MSGNNIARKVQRYMLLNGKMKRGVYTALRRKINPAILEKRLNDARIDYLYRIDNIVDGLRQPIRPRVLQVRLFAWQENEHRQVRKCEVLYHATKGWQVRVGDAFKHEEIVGVVSARLS